MALIKRVYTDGETIITAQNLNDIQDEIILHGNTLVPKTRTVNGKALSSNITLGASDVGAAPTSHASSSTTYGKGTSSNYGHVKLTDSLTNTTTAASGGLALSAKAGKDLKDAIDATSPQSVTISASSSTTLSQDSSIEVYYAANGVITVTATVYLSAGGGSSGWKDLATIPTGYRPTHNVTSIGFSFDSAGITATYVARITSGGVIRVMALPNSTYCYFNITYQI